MKIYDATNQDGFFNLAGKAFQAIKTLHAAAKTTVPQEVEDYLAQVELAPPGLSMRRATEEVPGASQDWTEAQSLLSGPLAESVQNLLAEYVRGDGTPTDDTRAGHVKYLIDQMKSGGYYVESSAVGISATPAAGNSGPKLGWMLSLKRSDGRDSQLVLPETLTAAIETATAWRKGNLRITSPLAAPGGLLDSNWPQGSGINASKALLVAEEDSLVPNPNFDQTDSDGAPQEWILQTATLGTTLRVTKPEEQTVAISGSPTAGHYLLQWTDSQGRTWSTDPLAWNATAADVEAALREIPELGAVTVASTGTSPNFTHTITFTGVPGNPNQLVAVNRLDTGTVTVSTTRAGELESFDGSSLVFVGNGTEQTEVLAPLVLVPQKVYLLGLFLRRKGSPLAGTLDVALVKSPGGTPINDPAGNPNLVQVDLTAGSAADWQFVSGAFVLPEGTVQPVYLQLKLSTALDAGAEVFVDEVLLTEGVELYAGGPRVAATSWPGVPRVGDSWSLTATNDRAGELQEWMHRTFDLAALGLQLPTTGSVLVPDSVIS